MSEESEEEVAGLQVGKQQGESSRSESYQSLEFGEGKW